MSEQEVTDSEQICAARPKQWRVLLPLGLGTGLSLIGDAGLYAVLPTHTAEAGVLLVSVGILLSANRFVRLISNSSAGWLLDRFSRRKLFVPALFLGALSTAIYALLRGFWPLLLGRLLWGIAWSGIWVAGNAITFDVATDRDRGRIVGFYQVSFFSGAASGALLGGVFTDWLGFHAAMGVAASLTLLGALIALFFLPETSHFSRLTTAASIDGDGAKAAQEPMKIPELISATALQGINRVVIAGILTSTLGIYLLEVFGDTVNVGRWTIGVATLTGIGLSASTLISLLFTPMIGSLSDRVKNRWQVVAGGLGTGVAGFSLLALGYPLAILPGLPMTYFASSSNQGMATALVGDLASGGRHHGRYLGVLYTVGDLGSAISPPLAYALLPIWGVRGVYWLSAVLFGLMFLLALRWSMTRGLRSVTAFGP